MIINSNYKPLLIVDQIKQLKAQKLIFRSIQAEAIFEEYLRQYNYDFFIKKFNYQELKNEDQLTYKANIYSDDLRYLFDLDRNISSILWKYSKSIELHLNTTITYIIAKFIYKKTDSPYLFLLTDLEFNALFANVNNKAKNPYDELKTLILTNAKKNKFKDEIESNQNHEVKNIVNKIEAKVKVIDHEIKNWKKPDAKLKMKRLELNTAWLNIDALSSTWTISTLKKIYEALNDQEQIEARKEFFQAINKKNKKAKKKSLKISNEVFLEMINILVDFRNLLAHQEKIIDFNFKSSDDLDRDLNQILNIKIKGKNNHQLFVLITLMEKICCMDKASIIEEIKDVITYKKQNSNNPLCPIIEEIIFKEIGILNQDY